jgi:hypothetical protein
MGFASACRDEVASTARGVIRGASLEAALAVAAFAAQCALVLSVAPQSAEPDDGAYRASIVAITEGRFLTLSAAQAGTLARRLGDNPAAPPNQWVELTNGRYISEKDPGYPFLAAPFEKLGIIRLAPLFYGLLACLGLFIGARRWLGRFGGQAAVGLYCSSGAALAFAWRDGLWPLAVVVARDRGERPAAHLGRSRRVRGTRARDLRPLHEHRDTRLRRGRCRRGPAAASCEGSVPHVVLVACVGGRLRRRRGHL